MKTTTTMTTKTTLTAEQIEDALSELGETGSATVRSGALYTRREENADERYVGAVEDEAEAREIVAAWFRL